jgi:outer membrane lipoprotein-sorting protein
MVSDGREFKLYIPAKNRFVQGSNNAPPKPDKKLENLRPQHFLEAMVIHPPSKDESTILYNLTDEETAVYVLELIGKDQNGGFLLKRQIWLDRLNLQITRQLIFDQKGDILTDARYKDWQQEGQAWFPKEIEIIRPKDEYGVVMTVQKLELNKPLGAAQFTLDRPEGTELQVIAD